MALGALLGLTDGSYDGILVGTNEGTSDGLSLGEIVGSNDGTIEGIIVGGLLVSMEGLFDGYNGHANSLYISPSSPVAPFNASLTLSITNSLSSVDMGTVESLGIR